MTQYNINMMATFEPDGACQVATIDCISTMTVVIKGRGANDGKVNGRKSRLIRTRIAMDMGLPRRHHKNQLIAYALKYRLV